MSLRAIAVVKPQELSLEARKHVSQVPEFAYIQKAAEEIGVKVYLFGGSAAAYAHYVRWYIELQNGSENHQPERFDFDYTNIYRGNQDLDLVVDGTEAQAREFQKILKEKYAHIVGDKNDWEVRLLRAQTGDKLPLLDDPDFKNQHTDTNSTGMLDLTASEREPVFRDLLDWENEESQFLKDVAAARITYLFNPKHSTTSRYKEGKNPSIFSAVRYLAKLTQYEVEGNIKDLEIIKDIIQKTDFKKLSSYVKKKLEEFALKTLLNSPDSEYAWDLMDKLGLRKKLIAMDGDRINKSESLSWWLNKEPLRSRPLGSQGRTALEIFGKDNLIVSHETNSFQAYENITRSSRGEANVFISRSNIAEEYAAHGDGFYTQTGFKGARGTGLTVRFKLHPDARENEDFIVRGSFVIVRNKSALTLIQEDINITLLDFFKLYGNSGLSKDDKGLSEKFKRKFKRQFDSNPNGSKEFEEAVEFVRQEFFVGHNFPIKHIQDDYEFSGFDDLFETYQLLESYFDSTVRAFLNRKMNSTWFENPHWVKELIDKSRLILDIVIKLLPEKGWETKPWILESIIDLESHNSNVISRVLSQKHWSAYPRLVEKIISQGKNDYEVLVYLLTDSYKPYKDKFLVMLEHNGNIPKEFFDIYRSQDWVNGQDFLLEILRKVPHIEEYEIVDEHQHSFVKITPIHPFVRVILNFLTVRKRAIKSPDLIMTLVQYKWTSKNVEKSVIKRVLNVLSSDESWASYESIVESIIDLDDFNSEVIEFLFKKDYWTKHVDLLKKIIAKEPRKISEGVYVMILRNDHLRKSPGLMNFIIEKNGERLNWDIIQNLVNIKAERIEADIVLRILRANYRNKDVKYKFVQHLVEKHFEDESWSNFPELIEEMLDYDMSEYQQQLLLRLILKEPWARHDHLVVNFLEKHPNYGSWLIDRAKEPSYRTPLKHYKKLVEKLIEMNEFDEDIIRVLFKGDSGASLKDQPSLWFSEYPELLVRILQKKQNQSRWSQTTEAIKNLTNSSTLDRRVVDYILSQKYSASHPEVLLELVKKGTINRQIRNKVLKMNHWKRHPELQKYLRQTTDITLKDLQKRLNKLDFQTWKDSQKKQCFELLAL